MIAAEFARLAGVSEATVSRLASGQRHPSLSLVGKTCEILGWSTDEQVYAILNKEYASEFSTRLKEADTKTR